MNKIIKSVAVMLLDGRSRRILKEDVVSVVEQQNIMGGVDVEVWLKSGRCFISSESKPELERKFQR